MAQPSSVSLISDYGFAEDENYMYRSSMEDTHLYVQDAGPEKENIFLGVFDGHGGTSAAQFARDNIHKIFLDMCAANPSATMPSILADTFKMTDKKMEKTDIDFDGCTAAVIYIKKEEKDSKIIKKIYSANCGDARSILVRNGRGLRLSYDHKPTLTEEQERIRGAGGFVSMGRVNGILAVSRALGDFEMKKYVICDPFVSETIVDPENDTHIIIACDGVWDVLSDDEVAQIVTEKKASGCEQAAKAVKQKALTAGSTDNISVMVVQL